MYIQTQEFTYTPDELLQMHRATSMRRADYFVIVLWLASIFFIISWINGIRSGAPKLQTFAIAVTLSVMAALIVYSLHYWMERKTLVAMSSLSARHFTFGPDSVTMTLPSGESAQANLTDLMLAVINKGLIFLYFAPGAYWAIPWRAFQFPSEVEQVDAALRAHNIRIGKKHPPRPPSRLQFIMQFRFIIRRRY